MSKYIIVDADVLLKKIEELEKDIENINLLESGQLSAYKEILSQSTPLISVLEQAYFEGECYGIGTDACISKQDYISNLKIE
jgi:hypothetical protein